MFFLKPSKTKLLKKIERDILKGSLKSSCFPIEWFFELSKHCNIKCLTCGRIYDKSFKDPKNVGNMSLEILKSVDKCLKHSFVVHSVGFGEPFMNPHALSFIKTIKKHKAFVDIIHNGTLLKGKADELIQSGLDSLIVSMDGGTKEVFEHFRAGAKWDKVVEGLKELDKRKKEKGAVHPELIIEFVAMSGNLDTFPRLVELAATQWGAASVTVEPLFKGSVEGYLEFYLEQNLSTLPYERVDALFSEAGRIADKHGIRLLGPYFQGDRKTLWEQARFDAISNMDYPAPGSEVNGLRDFVGWALHPHGVKRVSYRIGEGDWKTARYGEPSPGVFENIPQNYPDKKNCGFVIPIDPNELTEGENLIEVTISDKAGGVTSLKPLNFIFKPAIGEERPIKTTPPARLRVDTPVPNGTINDPYLIAGWFNPPIPDSLRIKVEGRTMGEAIMGAKQPELKETIRACGYHDPEAARCVFFFPLDLKGFDEGPLTVSFELQDHGEDPKEVCQLPVTLSRGSDRKGRQAREHQGQIEFPQENKKIFGTQAFLGWAVYGPDTERIWLESAGEKTGRFCHDFPRTDIRPRFEEKDLSDRIGFCVLVDTEELPSGKQSFSLVAKEKSGQTKVLSKVSCLVSREVPEDEISALGGEQELGEKGALFFKDPTRKTAFSPFCTLPWTTTYVTFDGLVRPCCFSETSIVLGDLNRQSFKEIWEGESYQRLRQEILNGMVPDFCKLCVASARIHGRSIFEKFKEFLD